MADKASIAVPLREGRNKVAIELCCGLGGISLGLRALGFQVAKAYDSWEEAVAVYNHNALEPVASTCNLLSGNGRAALKAARRECGDVELLAAGPPCKGFSQLRNGRQDGRNGHNRVLAAMPECIALLKPRLVLIENVPDLARHRGGKTLRSFLDKLAHPARGLRYRAEHQIFDASSYGTPQSRRRIFILAVREGRGRERLPPAGPDLGPLFAAVRHGGTIPTELRVYMDILEDPENLGLTSSSQALSDLPLLQPGQPESERQYASEPRTAYQRWVRQGAPKVLRDTRTPRVNPETLSRLRHVPPGGCARALSDEHLNGLARRYDSAYRRLHPDTPSTALSTRYDCVYHYAAERSLSVREYARLQGLPDLVTFPSDIVCRRNAYEMIGNSVPPQLIEGVLGAAIRTE